MTNAAIKATFSTHKTNRVVAGDLDHPSVRFAPLGSNRVEVYETGDRIGLETHPAIEFQLRLEEALGSMTRGYNW